jgi:hypothetical protein
MLPPLIPGEGGADVQIEHHRELAGRSTAGRFVGYLREERGVSAATIAV